MIPKDVKEQFPNMGKTFFLMVCFVVLGLIVAKVSIMYLGNDNPIEQKVEEVIEAETGLKIDFSTDENPTT